MSAVVRDHNDLNELIDAHSKRLHVLRVQEARFGNDAPAHIVAEIDQIEAELAQLKAAAAQPISSQLVEELGPTGRYQLWMSHIMRLDAQIGHVRRDVERLHERFDDLLAALAKRGIRAASKPRSKAKAV